MQGSRRYKTQICPQMELLLYKSAQLKNPYYVKNRHNIGKQNSNSKDSSFYGYGKSSYIGSSQSKPLQSAKFSKFNKVDSHRGHESKTCQCKSVKTSKVKKKIVATQPIQNLIRMSKSQSKQYSQQNIQQLLGINTERSKKQNIVNNKIIRTSYKQNYQQINHFIKLKQHNEELMRNNQQLIYEKQFYKQKVLLQEVQIRDLNRKLQAFMVFNKSKGHKKKLSFIQQPQISFKIKANSSLQIPTQINQSYGSKQCKDENIISQKSSMLISQQSQARVRIPLCDKQIGENISRTLAQSDQSQIYMKKTQNQFSQLLQNIQSQSNQGRKATLRKMLAMKAVQLKKLKGKQ